VKADDFEARMRLGECFHTLRVPPGAFIVIRADGRSFSRLAERLAEKPFDGISREDGEDGGGAARVAPGYVRLRGERRDLGAPASRRARAATAMLEGASVAEKNEILFAHGINFHAVPAWQRRGTGIYWEPYEKDGHNPKTGQAVKATRRRIKANDALPMKEAYARFVRGAIR
jgi:tRNA(His) 5'-end guanylyltransferase